MTRRKLELLVITSALALDAVFGWLYGIAEHLPIWHSMYVALANAVTLGGDVSPVNGYGYLLNTLECVLVVPLFAATFSLFTTVLTTADVKAHINRKHEELKDHITKETKK
jgi:hypothetical protein